MKTININKLRDRAQAVGLSLVTEGDEYVLKKTMTRENVLVASSAGLPRIDAYVKRTTKVHNEARAARIAADQAETRAIVATGRCPRCDRELRRNLSITGWWQCSQLGAETHRADPTQPSCRWQGFTE